MKLRRVDPAIFTLLALLQVPAFFPGVPDVLRPVFVFLGWSGWWWALRDGRGLRSSVWGGAAMALAYLILLYWIPGTIVRYSNTPTLLAGLVLVALALYLGAYWGVLHGLTAHLPWGRTTGWTVAWTAWALYLLQARLLGGFPWGTPAAAWSAVPILVQPADVIGAAGLSALVVWSAWLVANLQRHTRRRAVVLVGLACLFVAYTVPRQATVMRRPARDRLRVWLVQPSIPQDIKIGRDFLDAFLRQVELSQVESDRAVDLIVWPEASLPGMVQPGTPQWAWVQRVARQARLGLLLGTLRSMDVLDRRQFYNSAFLIGPDGFLEDYYDKVHLVPFGEYVPLRRLLFFIDRLVPGMEDLSPGALVRPIETARGPLGVSICFESVFSRVARTLVARGARALFVLTNDAWFGRTAGPYQHWLHSVLRTVETRRSLVFVANTGISSLVSATGRPRMRTGLFEERALLIEVPLRDDRTPYVRWGGWLEAVVVLGAVVMYLLPYLLRRRQG